MSVGVVRSRAMIPQELVEKIIDLHHDDPPALRILALVSEVWRQRSQTHLFREILLGGDKIHRAWWSITEFHRILNDRPAISRAIRTLTIQLGDWVQSDLAEVLGQILSALPCIAHLNIEENTRISTGRGLTPDVEASLRHALSCLQVPCLDTLSLYGFNTSLLRGIEGWERIPELVLENTKSKQHTLTDSDAVTGSEANPSISTNSGSTLNNCLRLLRISHCGEALQSFISPAQNKSSDPRANVISLSHLVIDTTDFDNDMFDACRSLMSLCASTLKSYTVIYEDDPWTDLPEPMESLLFQFSRFLSLEELVVGTSCDTMARGGVGRLAEAPSYCTTITQELKTLGQAGLPVCLKRIAIVTVLSQPSRYYNPGPTLLTIAKGPFWREVGNALSEAAFTELQVLSIEFEIKDWLRVSDDDWNVWSREIMSNFTDLSGRGVSVQVVR